jgi:hypothetical protein
VVHNDRVALAVHLLADAVAAGREFFDFHSILSFPTTPRYANTGVLLCLCKNAAVAPVQQKN